MIRIFQHSAGLVAVIALMTGAVGCGSDKPSFCQSLNHSSALHGLNRALGDLADPGTSRRGKASLRRSADALRQISSGAPPSLRRAFTAAATSLDLLADSGISSGTRVRSVSNDLSTLGSKVQSQCHFPVD